MILCQFTLIINYTKRHKRQDSHCNRAVTWRSYPVLPGGFVIAQGEEENLDGADKDPGQEAIKDKIEEEDFCCGERKRETGHILLCGDILSNNSDVVTAFNDDSFL